MKPLKKKWRSCKKKRVYIAFTRIETTFAPRLSIRRPVPQLAFWTHCPCPSPVPTAFAITAPAHPHTTDVSVYPTLFADDVFPHSVCFSWPITLLPLPNGEVRVSLNPFSKLNVLPMLSRSIALHWWVKLLVHLRVWIFLMSDWLSVRWHRIFW